MYVKGPGRSNMKAWKTRYIELFDIVAKDEDPHKFDGPERDKEYYYDQKKLTRKW